MDETGSRIIADSAILQIERNLADPVQTCPRDMDVNGFPNLMEAVPGNPMPFMAK